MLYTLSFVYIFASWLKRERTPPVSSLKHIYWWTDVLDQHWKCLQKRLIIFMLFTCNIYRDKWFHIEKELLSHVTNLNYSLKWNAVRKVCKLVQKEICSWMPAKFCSGQTNINFNFWVWGGSTLWFLTRSVQCDPRTLSFYHSMFSCNSTTLAILKYVCNKSQRKSLHSIR